MSSTITNTFNTELTYSDYTSRTYKVPVKGEMSQEIYDAAKAQIRAFNTAAQNPASSVAQTFVSDNGNPVVSISEVTLVTREEEVIYSG